MNPSVALDYFSIARPTLQHSHLNDLSCSSPQLLAYRRPVDLSSTMSSKIRPTQPSAGHKSSSRPQPMPMQNMLHVTGDDSGSDSSSSSSYYSSGALASPPELARCSRCQRTPSVDLMTGKSNMVQYGLNLWYCNRCAALVGWSKG